MDAAGFDQSATQPTLDAPGSGGRDRGGWILWWQRHLPGRQRTTAALRRRPWRQDAAKDDRTVNTLNAFTYGLDKFG
jgi:hypothetical protein